MSESKPYAVLVGADDVRGLYALRNLARNGVPVVGVLKERWSPGGWSRHWDRVITANTDDPEEVFSVLARLGPTFPEKAVLIPCFDTTVVSLARNRSRLEEWYHILQPRPEVVEMMMNKVSFYGYAFDQGFPLPTTSFLYDDEDLESSIDRHQFPVVVKPPASKHPAWQALTHIKALKAETRDDLSAILDQYRYVVDGPMIIQDWIDGSDEDLYACHVVYGRDGMALTTFTSRKVRQWPPYTGEVSMAVEVDSPAVREVALNVFDSVQFQGIGFIEMKRDPATGRFFLIEPNLRISGRAGLADAAGVELIYTMYCEAIGATLPNGRQQQASRGKKWIFLRKDLQAGFFYWRHGQLTLGEWLASMRGVSACGIWSWTDPGPFVGDLMRGLRLKSSPSERSKRDFRNLVRT